MDPQLILAGSVRHGQTGQENAWLDQLAEHALLELAGTILGPQPPLGSDPQPDPRPVAPDQHLGRMLGNDHPEMLPEWLRLVDRQGWRCPGGWLAPLLDWGRRQSDSWEQLRNLGGTRAAWMSRQNPSAWGYLLEDDNWHSGSRAARLAWLRKTRLQDAQQARETLESDFKTESASDRELFLKQLETNLSRDDEPFLESCLDDRAQGVRSQAAILLSALPESALAQRWRVRLETWKGEPPRQVDEAMARDGLEPKAPRGQGQRAFWLEQAVGLAPLGSTAQWDRLPEVWETPIRSGWALAALRQQRPDWAQLLLCKGLGNQQLFDLLSSDQQAALIDDQLEKLQLEWLSSFQGWTRQRAARVLEAACQSPESLDFSALARALPPGMELPAEQRLSARQREHFYDVQSFRKSMHEELDL